MSAWHATKVLHIRRIVANKAMAIDIIKLEVTKAGFEWTVSNSIQSRSSNAVRWSCPLWRRFCPSP